MTFAVLAFYAALTAGMAWSAVYADRQARIAAALLALGWITCTVLWMTGTGRMIQAGPVLDLIGGLTAIALWIRHPRNWLLLLAVSYMAQTSAHVAYQEGAFTYDRQVALQWALNLTYILQLGLVAVGPRAGVIVGLFRNLPRRAGHRYRLGCVRASIGK